MMLRFMPSKYFKTGIGEGGGIACADPRLKKSVAENRAISTCAYCFGVSIVLHQQKSLNAN